MLSALWPMFWVDGTAQVTGVAATSALGALSATGDASAVLAGVAADSALGTLVAAADGDAIATILGVEAVASVGVLTAAVIPDEVPPPPIGILGGTGFYPSRSESKSVHARFRWSARLSSSSTQACGADHR